MENFSILQIKKLTEENVIGDIMTEDENDELFIEWSSEQLRKRSQELQLLDGNGKYIVSDLENRLSNENINRNRSVIENSEKYILEVDNDASGASTTSDSQVIKYLIYSLNNKLIPKVSRYFIIKTYRLQCVRVL